MSEQDRLNWISRGSPYVLMRPLARLRDRLRAHGYTVYDIGNRAHLEHEPPEDHTPYSETGWPGDARYGVGYAIDIMPPAAGAKSKLTGKTLPTLQVLGAQMVKDRNAAVLGIAWLKYQNWEPERNNGGPCYKDAWRPTYRRTSSTDRGHIHQSGATGYETSSIGDDYDPVARVYGEDDEMALSDRDAERLIWRVDALVAGRPTVIGGPSVGERVIANERIIALAAAVARLPGAESLRVELDQLDQAVAAARTDIAGVDEAVIEGLAGMDVVDLAAVLRRGLSADQVAALAAALANPAS